MNTERKPSTFKMKFDLEVLTVAFYGYYATVEDFSERVEAILDEGDEMRRVRLIRHVFREARIYRKGEETRLNFSQDEWTALILGIKNKHFSGDASEVTLESGEQRSGSEQGTEFTFTAEEWRTFVVKVMGGDLDFSVADFTQEVTTYRVKRS